MIQLKGMTWDHPRGYQPLEASLSIAREKFGIEVTWERRSLKDFGDAPIDVIAQEYDLLIIDHPHAGLASSTGCLVALDEYIDADTLQIFADQSAGLSHPSYALDGHQWALAIDTATQVSVYRPDLLQDGCPNTWQGVIDLGKQLMAGGQYISIPLVPTDSICSFLTLNASLRDQTQISGKPFDETTGKESLNLLKQLHAVCHPESTNWNPIHLLDYMSENDDVVYCPLTFGYTNYSRDNYRKHKLRFNDIPQTKGALLGGTGFAVSSSCEHIQTAVDYGVWLCQADTQSGFYVEHGGQPGNRVAWTDDSANALVGQFFSDTVNTLDHAYLRPRHYGFLDFQEQAGHIIHGFLVADGDVETCYTALDDLYKRYVE